MAEQTFGRRASERPITRSTPRQEATATTIESSRASPDVPLGMIAGCVILLLAIGTGVAASLNWAATVSMIQPSHLERVSVSPDTARDFPYWTLPKLNKSSMADLASTVIGFHEVCGNTASISHWESLKTKLNLNAGDSIEGAHYRPDRFDYFSTREDVIKRVRAMREDFCGREYWQALYDARILSAAYFSATQLPVIATRAPVTKPVEIVKVRDNRPTEPDYNISSECARSWPTNYTMQEFCIKQAKEAMDWYKRASIDTDVAKNCAGSWPTNWNMFKFCANQQQEAKRRIGR